MIDTAQIQAKDWVKLKGWREDWYEVISVAVYGTGVRSFEVEDGCYASESFIIAHRPHDRGFKVGDKIICKTHSGIPDTTATLCRYHDLQSISKNPNYTLVKPVEAIEAEQEMDRHDMSYAEIPLTKKQAEIIEQGLKEESPMSEEEIEAEIENLKKRIEEVESDREDAEREKALDEMAAINQETRQYESQENPMIRPPTLTPIPGPPDLEGVPDDALYVVEWEDTTTCRYAREMRKFTEWCMGKIIWHIPLGVIEEPQEVTLPKCPWCNFKPATEMGKMFESEGRLVRWVCFNCDAASPWGHSEQEVLKRVASFEEVKKRRDQ